jgi:hypothetical protein
MNKSASDELVSNAQPVGHHLHQVQGKIGVAADDAAELVGDGS